MTNTAYHITGDSPVTTEQIRNSICKVLRLDNVSVGTGAAAGSANSDLMSRFIGDLYPYFSSDIVFDQSNVRKVLGDKVLDWEYGEKSLEILIRSFYKDYFPNVEWLQKLAVEEPDRMPR